MNISRTTYEALGLKTFSTLACRLSGESSTSRRLEVGIARLVDGEIATRQDFSFPISSATQSKRRNTSKILLNLIGQEPVVVFDQENLRLVLSEADEPFRIPDALILDAAELSRIVFPWLDDFHSERIARHLEIQRPADSSILSEAEQIASIFIGLLPEIITLDFALLDLILRLLEGSPDGFLVFFQNVIQLIRVSPLSRGGRLRITPKNILGKPAQDETESPESVRPEEINTFFEPGGPLDQMVSNYERRQQQVALARSVAVTLNQDEFLLAEAGTGVGKSLAYLVPAVLWTLKDRSRRVIIATHTKTLQDQLFRKEIPLLFESFDSAFQAVLLKGRSNYLCLRRWESLTNRINSLNPNIRRAILPLVVWASETRDGDIEENGAFLIEQQRALWNQINADDAHCMKSGCPDESRCFVHRARRAAKTANLVVVNHALLFSDFVSSHAIIGAYDTLIVDEAHQFEKIATQHLGSALLPGHFTEILDEIYNESSRRESLIRQTETLTGRIANPEHRQKVHDLLDTIRRTVVDFRQQTSDFFQKFILTLQSQSSAGPKQKIRFRENPFQKWVPGETESLITRLEHLAQILSGSLQIVLNEIGATPGAVILETEQVQVLERLVEIRRRIEHFYTSDYQDNIVWCEFSPEQQSSLRLYSVPLEIASLLATQFYASLSRCVMTSATLTVGGSFDYMVSRLGLDLLESERLVTTGFGSPFNYTEQALIQLPTFLPSPKESNFTPVIAQLIQQIIHIHHRGMLVLFTSYQMLQEVYDRVKTSMTDSNFILLGQGIDGPRSALLKRFQEFHDSVLFGTNSFWEGVDVPGAALELLIITKIPFDVPTEPVFEARYEFVELQTGSGFLNYAVPEAIIRFRQGFGRLIRSASDRGAVLLLDRRAVSTQYGKLLIKSLPTDPVLPNSEEELLTQLQDWFQEIPLPQGRNTR